jgi:TRC40/GET3/ArsA family transport-energizing ATPase
MEDLAGKRLIIFAGKGGVGKTTCSAACALELAKRGKRTLLVTVDPAKRLEDCLGVPVGFTETPIQPRLAAMMLDPEAVIREHLQREVPEAKIADHPLFKTVTGHLPGLNELMAIGKLNDFRRANKYDVIVVDTAPTGHALSFLSAPKTIQEILSERSLVRWAIKGYGVWQKLSAAARGVGNVFKKKEDREEGPPDIDFERIFQDMGAEAQRIRDFLTDPAHSAFVVVSLPEKLPVEETADLHRAVTEDLGMTVHTIVVNRVQPDALGDQGVAFQALAQDKRRRAAFSEAAGRATGEAPGLFDAMVSATEFSELRRRMNLEQIEELQRRLPGIPLVLVPLFKQDVVGLKALGELRQVLFDASSRREPSEAPAISSGP